MIKIKIIFIIAVSFILIRCDSNDIKELPIVDEKAVIIFNGIYNNSIKNKNGMNVSVNPVLSINQFSENFINDIIIERTSETDTFIFDVDHEKILLTHMGVEFDKLHYLLSRGDTLIINYNDNYPSTKILSKDSLSLFYINKIRISPQDLQSTVLFDSDFSNFSVQKKIKFIEKRRKIFSDYEQKLDSLYQNNLISEDYYDLEKAYLVYSQAFYEFPLRDKLLSEDLRISNKHTDFQNETHLQYPFYQHYLKQQYEGIVDVPLLNISNGTIWDYRAYYDSLENSPGLSLRAKEFLKYTYVNLIAQEFTKNDFQDYYNRFINSTPDSAYIKALNENYLVDILFRKDAGDEFVVTTLEKEGISIDSLYMNYYDTVVYIDFWASWCYPCIRVMPDIKKLEKEFANEKFKVVYISLDKSFEKWQNSVHKYGLEDNENFFSLDNPTKIFGKNNQASIPRYFLLDKDGAIVNSDAPAPGSNEIRKLISDYIKN